MTSSDLSQFEEFSGDLVSHLLEAPVRPTPQDTTWSETCSSS